MPGPLGGAVLEPAKYRPNALENLTLIPHPEALVSLELPPGEVLLSHSNPVSQAGTGRTKANSSCPAHSCGGKLESHTQHLGDHVMACSSVTLSNTQTTRLGPGFPEGQGHLCSSPPALIMELTHVPPWVTFSPPLPVSLPSFRDGGALHKSLAGAAWLP